jgi:hypothetical protein
MSITINLGYATDASFWLKKDQWTAFMCDGEIAVIGDSPEEALASMGELIQAKYPSWLDDLKKEGCK